MSIFDKDMRLPDEILYDKCKMVCDIIPMYIRDHKSENDMRYAMMDALRNMDAYTYFQIAEDNNDLISNVLLYPHHIMPSTFFVRFFRRKFILHSNGNKEYYDLETDIFAQFTVNKNGIIY